jgi:hypothetical protein
MSTYSNATEPCIEQEKKGPAAWKMGAAMSVCVGGCIGFGYFISWLVNNGGVE